MKEPIREIGVNGFSYCGKNKGFIVIENPDGSFSVEFRHYVGKNIVTSKTHNVKGIAFTEFSISKETMFELASGFIQYINTKKK